MHAPSTRHALSDRSAQRLAERVDRLAGWPSVARRLRSRQVSIERLPDETPERQENRLGTELMALYRDSRSHQSFEALYAFARPSLLQWIQGLLGRDASHIDATELLQDTFVNVYRYPSGFRDEHSGSFRVWVRTIAGNLVRRAKARAGELSLQGLPEGLQEPSDPRVGPASQVSFSEQQTELRGAWILFLLHYADAWQHLRGRDRLALELVEVNGVSYADAGQILGVGRSNMKMIVFRARKRIAARMRSRMEHEFLEAQRATPRGGR